MLAAVAALAACGGAGPRQTPTEREWIDNGGRLLDGLREDIGLSANGGVDVPSARRALRSDSALYAMLVAYTAFGSCGEMLRNVGPPAHRLRRVERTLAAACVRFERSAAIFTRAMTGSDPRVLLAATRTAASAFPLLARAEAELEAVRASLGRGP